VKRNSFFDAVGDTTHSAAEKGRDALYQAGDLLGDLGDYLAPKARDLGKETISGAEVMSLQALEQFVLYTGVRPDAALVAEATAFSRQA